MPKFTIKIFLQSQKILTLLEKFSYAITDKCKMPIENFKEKTHFFGVFSFRLWNIFFCYENEIFILFSSEINVDFFIFKK